MKPHDEPEWLKRHRGSRPYVKQESWGGEEYPVVLGLRRTKMALPPEHREAFAWSIPKLLLDDGFNSHEVNDGTHVSPYDNGQIMVGTDNIKVRMIQGIDEDNFKRVLSRALRATTGISPDEPIEDLDADADEMLKGGLQAALETQVIVFEVTGASRAVTHQLVRSRKAGFHQQSQRATWYGDRPDFREPMSVHMNDKVREIWDSALLKSWEAYKAACDAGISYQDARYILPEGTGNYILCEYTVREFINVFAYRGCSGFLWEMVEIVRQMRDILVEAHPFLKPHVLISCEKPTGDCSACGGQGIEFVLGADNDRLERPCSTCGGDGKSRRCTFQGWENVEKICDFPWAKQGNRTFLPQPRLRIGG